MIYLIIAVMGSVAIPLIIRLSNGKATSKYGMFLCNYITCLVLSLITLGEFRPLSYGKEMLPVFIIGAISGICYLASLFYYDVCIQKTGLVITSIFKKTSIIVSIFIAVVIFGNELNINQLIGIVLCLAAVVVMNYQKGSFSKISHLGVLLLNAMLAGMCESVKNIFNEVCDGSFTNYYVTFLFLFAAISTIVVMLIKKSEIGKYEMLYGFAFGIPNFVNAKFLTLALAKLNPVYAFPAYTMLTMLVTAAIGVIFLKESIDLKKIIAMIIVIAAMIILNI